MKRFTKVEMLMADIQNTCNLSLDGATVEGNAAAYAIDCARTRPAPVVTPIQLVLARLR